MTMKSMQFDIVIIDTAGRLHVDEELMNELNVLRDGKAS